MSVIDRNDRIITTTDDMVEAEMLRMSLAAAVVEIGAQATWCVYTKPYRLPGTGHRFYAVCVGRLFEAI